MGARLRNIRFLETESRGLGFQGRFYVPNVFQTTTKGWLKQTHQLDDKQTITVRQFQPNHLRHLTGAKLLENLT